MGPPASHRIPRVLWYSGAGCSLLLFVYAAFTLSGGTFQSSSTKNSLCFCRSTTPKSMLFGLGSSHFARRYFGNRCFFLFLSLLRCFSSGGSPSYVMDWRMSTWSLSMWVSPFRNLRIKGYLLLPEAYRSLSRLSSALSARASTPRSLKLNQTSHPAGTGFDSRRIALRPLVHGLATAQDSRFSKQRRREVLALQCEALRKSIGRKSKPAKKSKIFELVLRCYYLIHTFVCFLFSDVLIKFLSKLISLISLQYAVFKVRC